MKGIFKPGPILGIFILTLCATFHVAAQAPAGEACPADKVCISREAALKALADADKVKADEAAIAGYKQAIEDLKAEVAKMRVEFAAVSGENTALKQAQVRYDAILDLALKNTRKKCSPLSICF